YRAADRREGAEPCDQRRALSVRGPLAALRRALRCRSRRVFGAGAGAGLEGAALLDLDDAHPAPHGQRRPGRPAAAGSRTRLPRQFGSRREVTSGELCGPAILSRSTISEWICKNAMFLFFRIAEL